MRRPGCDFDSASNIYLSFQFRRRIKFLASRHYACLQKSCLRASITRIQFAVIILFCNNESPLSQPVSLLISRPLPSWIYLTSQLANEKRLLMLHHSSQLAAKRRFAKLRALTMSSPFFSHISALQNGRKLIPNHLRWRFLFLYPSRLLRSFFFCSSSLHAFFPPVSVQMLFMSDQFKRRDHWKLSTQSNFRAHMFKLLSLFFLLQNFCCNFVTLRREKHSTVL